METNLTEQQSLKIIQEMIATSKSKLRDNSFFYLLWGWLVLIASLTHYFLLRMNYHEYAYLPWPILMLGGMVVSIIAGIRLGKKAKVVSHFDNMMIYLWYGFFFTIMIMIVNGSLSENSLDNHPFSHYITLRIGYICIRRRSAVQAIDHWGNCLLDHFSYNLFCRF